MQNDLVEKLNGQPPLVIGSFSRGKADLPWQGGPLGHATLAHIWECHKS